MGKTGKGDEDENFNLATPWSRTIAAQTLSALTGVA